MPVSELAIIVASQGSPTEAVRCLDSILQQKDVIPDQLEIVLVEAPPYAVINTIANHYSDAAVQFVRCQGSSLPQLHGSGICSSSAPLVALTEAHCTFTSNWATTALAAHKSCSDAAIGGCVLPGRNLGLLNTGLFFCDYAQFLPPLTAAQTSDLPGNNVIFKRSCLSVSPALSQHGFWKTFHCKALYAAGKTMHNQPDLTVYYNRQLSLGQIARRRYNHGRCFGGMRASELTASKRAFLFFAGPLLPLLLTTRLWHRSWPKKQYQRQFLASSTAAFLCTLLWSFGEWIGTICGAGKSCEVL